MKVGDLVTRHPTEAQGSRYPAWPGGIVTVMEANDTHAKVYWPEHGAVWCPVNQVEVVSAV